MLREVFRNHGKWLATFAVSFVCSLSASSMPAWGSSSLETTLLAVSINGQEMSEGAILLRESDGSFAISQEDAHAWRLSLPEAAMERSGGKVYFALHQIPRIRAHFNDEQQKLELTVPASCFEKTTIDRAASQEGFTQSARQRGAFLNYDLREQAVQAQSALGSGVFDTGVTLGHGVIDASFLGTMGADNGAFRRLSTSWQEDDIARMTTVRIGDAAAYPGVLVTGQPFFGVQFFSNFSTAPGLLVNPHPQVDGELDTPGNADIYVNGRLVVRQILPMGPFQINNIPLPGDVGTVQVVVKDAMGQQQVLTQPFFNSPSMLRKGLTEFSWGAGIAATQLPTGGQNYALPVAVAFHRHGFSDRFTGELDAQLLHDASALSGGGTWLLPRVGIFDLALSSGSGTEAGGSRFDYEYVSRGPRFGFSFSSLRQNLQNQQIVVTPGIQSTGTPTRASQIHFSSPLLPHGSVFLSINNQHTGSSDGIRTLNASYATRIGHMQMNLNYFKSSGTLASKALTLSLLLPLNNRQRVSSTMISQDGQNSATATFATDPELDGVHDKLGYVLNYGTANASAQALYSQSSMDLLGGVSRVNSVNTAALEVRGSLALLDHQLFPSRSIQQAYGLAWVPGYPGVRVYSNGQFVGKTDSAGKVLLPNLNAYQRNSVTLEQKDFPLTANLDSFEKDAVPYYHIPTTVHFPVRGVGGVLVHLKRPDGHYVPSGATLTTEDGLSWPVADQGEAYLEGVFPGSLKLTAAADELHCEVSIIVPKDTGNIPDLGDAICR